MSDRLSIAQHYHERTKYHPETIAANSQSLDWENQPSPFKDYKIGTTIDLKPHLSPDRLEQSDDNQLEEADQSSLSPPAEQLENRWHRLSRLLLCSYGLTAKVLTEGGPFYLRAAPSAGGLYPAELYLIARGSEKSLLSEGLYHYQPRSHSLVQFWNHPVWPEFQSACCNLSVLEDVEFALVITAVFFRSAWRYQDRAYRRIFLDTGHILGNLELAGAMSGYRPSLVRDFLDPALNQLLYLDESQEGAITVLALTDPETHSAGQRSTQSQAMTAMAVHDQYPEVPDGELITYLHQATQFTIDPPPKDNNADHHAEGGGSVQETIDQPVSPSALPDQARSKDSHPHRNPLVQKAADAYNFPFCSKFSTATAPITWDTDLRALQSTMLHRRSTREFSGLAISFGELNALLDFTYQPQHYGSQGLDEAPDYFDLSFIQTFIAVSSVEGLEPGCYYYAAQAQELRQVRFKSCRRELHFLCLGQPLGRDAAAVVFHTANLTQAVKQYGDRVYRCLHMDAGHLGQRLNLAAIRLDLGVSGIGGFFDDQVNEVLGIPEDEAVLYITVLGRPKYRA